MRSTIRLLAALTLMLLLPLQGMASAAGLRAMSQCPMMSVMQVSGDCEHAAPAEHRDHNDHTQGKASCDMGMNCPALGAVGMASAAPLLSIIVGNASLHAATEPHYTSHVPEGLQRPPRRST